MLGQETKPDAVAGYDETAFRDYLVSATRHANAVLYPLETNASCA
jgi:hypothetical protein